jgi:flagellar motor switch/type III secretory pathway protein FliN
MVKTEPKPWLPADALSPTRLQPLLARVIGDWGRHWFAKAEARIAPAFQDDWPGRSTEAGWRFSPGVASLALTPIAESATASAMLGANVPQAALQSGDRLVVNHLASTCADDLLTRLGKTALGATAVLTIDQTSLDFEGCTWWDISLGARKAGLKLAFHADAALQMVKRQLPRTATKRLGTLANGVAKQEIRIAANLGRSSLSLAELEGLAVGDVLILDRVPAEPVPLLIDGAMAPLHGLLETQDERPVLILADPGKRHV